MKSFHIIIFLLYGFIQSEIINPHAIILSNDGKIENNQMYDKRGGVARLVSDSSEKVIEDSIANKYIIVNYTFDNQISPSAKIKDDSGFDNNGIIDVGGLLVDITGSTCKVAAYLWDQSIKITFSTPDGVPKDGLSITMWLKMLKPEGERTVFSARGRHFGSMTIKFYDKTIRFSHHKCETCPALFDLMAETNITHDWFHLVASYNASSGIALVYINGIPLNRTINKNHGPFQYWGNDVRVGGHNHPSLKGFVDSLLIYNYALSSYEIQFLSLSCCFHNCYDISSSINDGFSTGMTSNRFNVENFDRRSLKRRYLNFNET